MIEQKDIDLALLQLDFIIDSAEVFIDPTPNHPRGCARTAWIDQAKYWKEEISKIDLNNTSAREGCIIGFAKLFISDYERLLSSGNIIFLLKKPQQKIFVVYY